MQFQALGMDHILRVVDKFLIELEAQLHEKNVTLSATPTAREWLAQHGFDPLMGARPMARVIQDKVKRPLADELLFGKLANGGAREHRRQGRRVVGRGPGRTGEAVAGHGVTGSGELSGSGGVARIALGVDLFHAADRAGCACSR